MQWGVLAPQSPLTSPSAGASHSGPVVLPDPLAVSLVPVAVVVPGSLVAVGADVAVTPLVAVLDAVELAVPPVLPMVGSVVPLAVAVPVASVPPPGTQPLASPTAAEHTSSAAHG
jgi:hypothetical protein